MADVILNPGDTGNVRERITSLQAALSMLMSITFNDATTATAKKATGAASADLVQPQVDELWLKTGLDNGFVLASARFSQGGRDYTIDASGRVRTDVNPNTNVGIQRGTLSGDTIRLTDWVAGSAGTAANFVATALPPIVGDVTPFTSYVVGFRTATAPLRPGSLQVLGTLQDGTPFNVTADADGNINATRIKGKVNYQTGVATLVGVRSTANGQTLVDLSFLGVPGVTTAYVDLIRQETLRYNAVAYTYLPLDADLLGIDPVRLPSDGRVPIFRPGELGVVGNTAVTAPQTLTAGGTINAGRVRLSRGRLLGNDGSVITTGYTEDLENGVLTATNVTGWSQPVRWEHRVEDAGLIRDAQIDGTVTFTRPLTHNYSTSSYLSTALRMGDLRSRVSVFFDQASWNGTDYRDALVGDAASGTYNTGAYPPEVTNDGAFTERWALRFKTSTTFEVIGEHVGNLGTFSTGVDCEPLNELTGKPYFVLPYEGWGTGWAVGNVVRMNTVGAMFPVWMIRTTQQGPESAADYSFLTVIRGDIDNPL